MKKIVMLFVVSFLFSLNLNLTYAEIGKEINSFENSQFVKKWGFKQFNEFERGDKQIIKYKDNFNSVENVIEIEMNKDGTITSELIMFSDNAAGGVYFMVLLEESSAHNIPTVEASKFVQECMKLDGNKVIKKNKRFGNYDVIVYPPAGGYMAVKVKQYE